MSEAEAATAGTSAEQETATITTTTTTTKCHVGETCRANATNKVVFKEIRPPNPPTFFGKIRERNITFCIDTSGSMYKSLEVVKHHLIEFLNHLVTHPLATTFNLVEFNTEVTQWSDVMMSCEPGVVSCATEWIKSLEAKTGTNTLAALRTAFSSESCNAVILITDGLPDQDPASILDEVSHISRNRPVHCYFIRNGFDPEGLAVEFLESLAMETYGSFNIAHVTNHGVLEKVTPVYHAEMAGERIIRSTHGRTYPLTHKVCTVTPTVDAPVDYTIEDYGPEYVVEERYSHQTPGLPDYLYYPTSDPRYFYSYNYPYQGWSRYHPSKYWRRSADKIIDMATADRLPHHLSPGAGSLLIDVQVLARRHDDGYFYKGKVKSQILEQKFLVEFGPCRHGKYKDTTYQETCLYDILSLDDSLRHSILVGDKVLAPYETVGERYGPATVIQGQENRQSDVTSSSGDSLLVVSFDHDGKSATLKLNSAVWIPHPFHERISFELKLPAKVRREIAANTEEYPLDSLPGYPKSGYIPSPPNYERFKEVVVERGEEHFEKGLYREPYFVPLYPVIPVAGKKKETEEEKVEVVAGTGLTKDELNEKVIQQIMEHKMLLEDIKRDQKFLREKLESGGSTGRLLKREQESSDNTLRKSVTFEDEVKDSGCGSVSEALSDFDWSDFEFDDDEMMTSSVAVGSDEPMGTRRQRRRVRKPKPWKYWGQDPSPNLLESNNFGKYRYGPFRECMMAAPLEAKTDKYGNEEPSNNNNSTIAPTAHMDTLIQILLNRGRHGARRPVPTITELTPGVIKRIERDIQRREKALGLNTESDDWRDTMYHVVRPGTSMEKATVGDSMGYFPRPPSAKPDKQGAGVDISIQLGDEGKYQQRLAGREARRTRMIEREKTWEEKRTHQETMGELMRDGHRERILNQIKQDWQRAKDDQEKVRVTRENKKAISSEIRSRIEENQAREESREQGRIDALRARRERHVRIKEDHERDTKETAARRNAIRGQNQLRYWAEVNAGRIDREQQQVEQDAAKRAAHAKRLQHFRRMEEQGQANKVRQNQVIEQRNAMMNSSIFS